MDAIKRYTLWVSYARKGLAYGDELEPVAKAYEDGDGAWVKYEDHLAALKAEGEPVAWKGLTDVQWMNIVNHANAWELWGKTKQGKIRWPDTIDNASCLNQREA